MWPLNGGSGLGKTSCALETETPTRAQRTATKQPASTDLPHNFIRCSPPKSIQSLIKASVCFEVPGSLLTWLNTRTGSQSRQMFPVLPAWRLLKPALGGQEGSPEKVYRLPEWGD